jgi:Zinc-finger associated domain (zf-AD).
MHFKVSQDDELPKTICYKCVSALEQSYSLWKVSSESEAVLKNFSSKAKQDLPEDNMQYKVCKLY